MSAVWITVGKAVLVLAVILLIVLLTPLPALLCGVVAIAFLAVVVLVGVVVCGIQSLLIGRQ